VAKQRSELVLIGPVCVGKSSVAARLSEVYGLAHHDLDTEVRTYYDHSPYFDAATYNHLEATQGPAAAYEYSGETLVWALQEYLADRHDGIFDIGAGYTSHRQPHLNRQTEEVLSDFANIVLLLPTSDPAQSVTTLRARLVAARKQQSWILDGFDYLNHWVTAPDYRRLASLIVYTDDDIPDQVAERIAASLHLTRDRR